MCSERKHAIQSNHKIKKKHNKKANDIKKWGCHNLCVNWMDVQAFRCCKKLNRKNVLVEFNEIPSTSIAPFISITICKRNYSTISFK